MFVLYKPRRLYERGVGLSDSRPCSPVCSSVPFRPVVPRLHYQTQDRQCSD